MARAVVARAPRGSLDALVVDVSGYDQLEVHGQGAPEGAAFLSKPFTQIALGRAVRAILDG